MQEMRKALVVLFSFLLIGLPVLGQAQGDTFSKLEYAGGMAALAGSKNDTASLDVQDTQITLTTADQKNYSFEPSAVTQLAYSRSQKVCRGCVIAGVLTFGVVGALFAFKKHKDHWITIALGQQGSLMIRAQKQNYKELIARLYKVTNKPFAIDPKEVEDLPSGVPTVAAAQ